MKWNLWQVRDRATLYLSFLTDGPEVVHGDAQAFLFQGLDLPLANLEASLHAYVSNSIMH
jgi:coatomer protein complex subunit gamma